MAIEIVGQRWKVLAYAESVAATPQDGELYVLSGVPNFEAPRVAVVGDGASTVAQLVAMRQTRPVYAYDDVDTDIPEAGTQVALTDAPDTTLYIVVITGDGTHTIAELVANFNANLESLTEIAIATAAALGKIAVPGDMKMIAHATPDDGWLLCDGHAVSRTAYSGLFSKIGLTWGVGDGSTTFNVPDMREVAPVGAGAFSAVTGTTRGAEAAADVFSIAEFKDDTFQEHDHEIDEVGIGDYSAGTAGYLHQPAASSSGTRRRKASSNGGGIVEHDSGGTPRTGTVTRGKRIGLNFVIKY